MRKILAILVDRANYGRMKPVLSCLQKDPDIELEILCTGTMLLPRFGKVVDIVEKDGFIVTSKIFMEVEGSTPVTMAKSIGLGMVQYSTELERIKPDIILVIGDRYEALSIVIAAAYMNIRIAHIQGGEVSGSIDESCRHAISKFSHIHFPSTQRSYEYLKRMGEDEKYIFNVGCPVGDYILNLKDDLTQSDISGGIGKPINLESEFILVIFHPVTTIEDNNDIVNELITILNELKIPTIWLWPNVDAGSDNISKILRRFRENNENDWLYLVKNFEPDTYQKLLKKTACAIGNSSSFIRDTTFSGTPVVLVGNRQTGREKGNNLIEPKNIDKNEIMEAILYQLKHGKYKKSQIYGNGTASQEILKILKTVNPNVQKTISYVNEEKSR